MAEVASRFNQPIPQQPPPNRFDLDLPDEEYLTGRQVKGLLQQFANQPAPVDHHARQLGAEAVYAGAQARHPEAFRRWKGEIDAEIRKLPIEYWTNQNMDVIVKMVRGEHADELAAEKAQRLIDESHPTIRSGTGGLGSVSNTQPIFESGPADMLARLKAVGITSEAELREACKGTGIEPAQYLAELEKYGKGAVIRG